MKELSQEDLLRIYVALKTYKMMAMFNSQKRDIQGTIQNIVMLLDEESKNKIFELEGV